LATTANLTGALSCDTLVPELSRPVRTPSATTPPPRVARNLVIFAVIESLDDLAPVFVALAFALATGATIAAHASTDKPAKTSLRTFPYLLDG
jgi:hypothetical protein